MALGKVLSALALRLASAALLSVLLPLAVAAQSPTPPAGAVPTPTSDTASCSPPQQITFRSGAVWDAQPVLIGKCLALVPIARPDQARPNIYTIAVSPHGTQNLFSREARLALERLAANYGGTAGRGMLLSNAPVDFTKVPLATADNLVETLAAIQQRMHAPDDILFLYLVSHGSPDAALATALPGNIPTMTISAQTLADALERTHIGRRVIIISACFSGSWIPRLASDDAIIIAAAAADRTSFGCAEDRPLTYFGDAFLNGPLSRGASLAQSFEGARKTVTQWEQNEKLLNSEPQAFVGKNMEAFWLAAAPNAVPAPTPPPPRLVKVSAPTRAAVKKH